MLPVSAQAVPPSFESAQASFLRGSANDGFHEALGKRLNDMMAMGASRPRPAILEYFAPLKARLDEQNKGQAVGWAAE